MGIKSLFLTTVIYSIYIQNITGLTVCHFSYLLQNRIVIVFTVVKLENGAQIKCDREWLAGVGESGWAALVPPAKKIVDVLPIKWSARGSFPEV